MLLFVVAYQFTLEVRAWQAIDDELDQRDEGPRGPGCE